jgi:hypothetical protein
MCASATVFCHCSHLVGDISSRGSFVCGISLRPLTWPAESVWAWPRPMRDESQEYILNSWRQLYLTSFPHCAPLCPFCPLWCPVSPSVPSLASVPTVPSRLSFCVYTCVSACSRAMWALSLPCGGELCSEVWRDSDSLCFLLIISCLLP